MVITSSLVSILGQHLFLEYPVLISCQFIGSINVAVDSANNLTKDIHTFTATVELNLENLRSVVDKVGAIANTLDTINALVVKQALREGIEIADLKSMNKMRQNDESKNRDGGERPESDVLNLRCFKNLLEASEGADRLFKAISQKLKGASDAIVFPRPMNQRGSQTNMGSPQAPDQPQQKVGGGPKVELSEADKARVYLTEKDIESMRNRIESHQAELHMRFIVFQFVL
jgi:flagellar capping protein FliD